MTMTAQDLTLILEETLGDSIETLCTLKGDPVLESKQVFNLDSFSYEGGLTLTSGQCLLWALNRDDEGWELSTLEM